MKQKYYLFLFKTLFAFIFSLAFLCVPLYTQASDTEIPVWDGTVAESFSGGDGSEENPYLISDARELALLARLVNLPETNAQFAPLYYKLTSDIDLGYTMWTPIGVGVHQANDSSNLRPFLGVFDGDDHTIYGLYLDGAEVVTWKKYTLRKCTVNGTKYDMYTEDGEPIYEVKTDSQGNPVVDENGNPVYKSTTAKGLPAIGLFGYNGGIIRNVTVSDAEVNVGYMSTAGVLCGVSAKQRIYRGVYKDGEYVRTSVVTVADTGVIENCKVKGGSLNIVSETVLGGTASSSFGSGNSIGGIAGYGDSAVIYGCFSSADICGQNVEGDCIAGGIVGRTEGVNTPRVSVKRCTYSGTIDISCVSAQYATVQVGGIAGLAKGELCECAFDGSVSVSGGGALSLVAAGGISGFNMSVTSMYSLFSKGSVYAQCPFNTPSATVVAGGISGMGGLASDIGMVSLCDAEAYSPNSKDGYCTASAVVGQIENTKYNNVYYHKDCSVTQNLVSGKSKLGVPCEMYYLDSKTGKYIDFSAYYESVKSDSWVYDYSVRERLLFEKGTEYSIDGTGVLTAMGNEAISDGALIIPFGTTGVKASAFDKIDPSHAQRVIVPSTLSNTYYRFIDGVFDGRTVRFGTVSHDKYINQLDTSLCDSFFVTSSGTLRLYADIDGIPGKLPDVSRISVTSGIYAVGKPSCLRINDEFNPSYFSYVSESASIPLHISPDTDFADYCEDKSIEYSFIGDVNADDKLSLADVSTLAKILAGKRIPDNGCICNRDIIHNKKVGIEDLHHLLRYFADTDVILGKEDD